MKKQQRRIRGTTSLKALRARIAELEETLRAIRSGEVDALLVSGVQGEQVFTLQGAEHPYRLLVEKIDEGAATLSDDGTTWTRLSSVSFQTTAPNVGTVAKWRVGTVSVTTPTNQNRTIEVEVNGSTYYISARTVNG